MIGIVDGYASPATLASVTAEQVAMEVAKAITGLSEEGVRSFVEFVSPDLKASTRWDGTRWTKGGMLWRFLVTTCHEDAKRLCGQHSVPFSVELMSGRPRDDQTTVVAMLPSIPGDATTQQVLARLLVWTTMRDRGCIDAVRPRHLPFGPPRLIDGVAHIVAVWDRRTTSHGIVPLHGDDIALWQWILFLRESRHGGPVPLGDQQGAALWAEIDRQLMIKERVGGTTLPLIGDGPSSAYRWCAARARKVAMDLGITLPPIANPQPLAPWTMSTTELLSLEILTR